MDVSGFHITVGGIIAVLSIVSSIGGVWRFIIKPVLESAKKDRDATKDWRGQMETRLTLLEHSMPGDVKVNIADLRRSLMEDRGIQ